MFPNPNHIFKISLSDQQSLQQNLSIKERRIRVYVCVSVRHLLCWLFMRSTSNMAGVLLRTRGRVVLSVKLVGWAVLENSISCCNGNVLWTGTYERVLHTAIFLGCGLADQTPEGNFLGCGCDGHLSLFSDIYGPNFYQNNKPLDQGGGCHEQ